jgi:hypothetical protein
MVDQKLGSAYDNPNRVSHNSKRCRVLLLFCGALPKRPIQLFHGWPNLMFFRIYRYDHELFVRIHSYRQLFATPLLHNYH